VQIDIDRDKYLGSGNCGFHAPATFDLTDDLEAMLIDRHSDGDDKVRLAAEGCPTQVFSLGEG